MVNSTHLKQRENEINHELFYSNIVNSLVYLCIIFKYFLREKFSNNYIYWNIIIVEIFKFLIIKYPNHNKKN